MISGFGAFSKSVRKKFLALGVKLTGAFRGTNFRCRDAFFRVDGCFNDLDVLSVALLVKSESDENRRKLIVQWEVKGPAELPNNRSKGENKATFGAALASAPRNRGQSEPSRPTALLDLFGSIQRLKLVKHIY
jgi:hypothetical protein